MKKIKDQTTKEKEAKEGENKEVMMVEDATNV